jgi:hypothetical protein
MSAQCSWFGTASEALHFEGNNYCPVCLQPLEAGVAARPVHLFVQRRTAHCPAVALSMRQGSSVSALRDARRGGVPCIDTPLCDRRPQMEE